LDPTLSPGARAHPHPALSPVTAAAGGGGRGLAQSGLEAKAGAIGRESLRVLAKAGIDRIVNRADNGLPDICAIIGVTETCIARNLMLSVGTLTVWISAAEVLAALLGSPLYCAVSEWLPTASEEIVKLAMPAASVPVPICTPPSNKLTDPVGESPVTFTANFTGCPKLDGFCDDDSAVVVPTSP